MKKIYSLILIVLVALFANGCSQKESTLSDVTLILDWVPNTNHTGIYVAHALGYFEEEGLRVEIIQPSDGGTAALIAANQGHFGISYQEEVTYARTAAEPLPIKAIAAIIQHNTSGFASPIQKGIVTPLDFEGKKYGGWGSPAEVAVLSVLMENEGADFNKLEMVDLGALDFFAATENHVDFTWIYYGWDGIAAELKGVDINFIKLQDFDENLDYYTPLIIASEKLLQESPDLAKAFLRAVTKGYEFAISQPEEAVKHLLKEAPEIDAEIAKASQVYLASEYTADASQWGIKNLNVWERYATWMYDKGLIENPLNASEAYTNDFLPQK